jgi:hypothetical protein
MQENRTAQIAADRLRAAGYEVTAGVGKNAVLTEGKTADITAARELLFAPGAMLVFDRGYADYN